MSPPVRVPLSDLYVDEELLGAAGASDRIRLVEHGPARRGVRARVRELRRERRTRSRSRTGPRPSTSHSSRLGCGPGDEVVLPSLNFVAAANVVRHTGATAGLLRHRRRATISTSTPATSKPASAPRTKAIVALHYGGYPCDMEPLLEHRRAARASRSSRTPRTHPAPRVGGRSCGTLGAVGCFSFFSNKNLPIGEGGMLVTDDDALAERFRLLRSHGMTTLTWDRHRGHASTYDVVLAGFNYRLDEVRAAMGVVQLGRLDAENESRARHVRRYVAALHGQGGIVVPFADRASEGTEPCAHHLAVILVAEAAERDPIRASLRDQGVQTSVHYPPIHAFTAYSASSERELPRTEALAARLVTLPLFGRMTDEQAEYVISVVLDVTRA